MAKKQVDDFQLFCAQQIINQKSTEDLKKCGNFLKQLLKLRKYDKLFSTYIKGIYKAIEYNEEDRIYADFRFDGTRTGRLSCKQYDAGKNRSKGVSFHTLARETEDIEIRDIFIAPNGKAFITADYSGMELRVLAHIGKVKKMIEAFQKNADLHAQAAAFAYGLELAEITKNHPLRNVGKTGNFLTVYGGGATNLAQMAGISLAKAKKFIKGYEELYPEVGALKRKTFEELERTEKVTTIFGRTRHLPNIKSRINSIREETKRQAFNTIISSPASDIALCCIVDSFDMFDEAGLDVDLVAFVHDSIELITDVKNVGQVCDILNFNMVNYPLIRKVWGLEFSVPLNIEMIVGKSFGSGVEAKFDMSNKLTNEQEILAAL